MDNNNNLWYEGKYVEVSDEVYDLSAKADRKDRYFSDDLKTEKIRVDEENEKITFIPSREDSFDRLIEENQAQFAIDMESVEDVALQNVTYEELHKAISELTEDEQKLIYALYFDNLTERDFAEMTGVYRNAVHKRKIRILTKLKNILESL